MNCQVAYGLWVVCLETLFRPWLIWEGEMDLKDTGWEIVCWVYVAQGGDQQQAAQKENGTEPAGTIRCVQFSEQLSNCQLNESCCLVIYVMKYINKTQVFKPIDLQTCTGGCSDFGCTVQHLDVCCCCGCSSIITSYLSGTTLS